MVHSVLYSPLSCVACNDAEASSHSRSRPEAQQPAKPATDLAPRAARAFLRATSCKPAHQLHTSLRHVPHLVPSTRHPSHRTGRTTCILHPPHAQLHAHKHAIGPTSPTASRSCNLKWPRDRRTSAIWAAARFAAARTTSRQRCGTPRTAAASPWTASPRRQRSWRTGGGGWGRGGRKRSTHERGLLP